MSPSIKPLLNEIYSMLAETVILLMLGYMHPFNTQYAINKDTINKLTCLRSVHEASVV